MGNGTTPSRRARNAIVIFLQSLRNTRTTETGESVLTSRLMDRAGPCALLRNTRTTETGESVLTSRLVDRAGPCVVDRAGPCALLSDPGFVVI
jgi:hypothetical protein